MNNGNGTATAEMPKTTAIAVTERNIADNVLGRVNELEKTGGLTIPANYSAANALKSAWLILQNTLDKEKRPVLSVCTKESVANTLLDMVIQGLSPSKKQCYFIAYGQQLQLSRSYMGSIAVTKRLKGVKDVFANCIFEGDEFEYTIDLDHGLKRIIKHNQKFTDINISKILGAYAIITREGLPPYVEIMNMNQIRAAWEQGKAGGNSGAHNKFTEEMAKKSVINRACKSFWNTSDDSDMLIDAINKTTDVEDLPETSYSVVEEVEKEVSEKANKELIDIKSEEGTVQNEDPTPADEPFDDWENPKWVVGKIKSFTSYEDLTSFTKKNLIRLSAFGGDEADLIQDAINYIGQKLQAAATVNKNGNGSKPNNKKAPF